MSIFSKGKNNSKSVDELEVADASASSLAIRTGFDDRPATGMSNQEKAVREQIASDATDALGLVETPSGVLAPSTPEDVVDEEAASFLTMMRKKRDFAEYYNISWPNTSKPGWLEEKLEEKEVRKNIGVDPRIEPGPIPGDRERRIRAAENKAAWEAKIKYVPNESPDVQNVATQPSTMVDASIYGFENLINYASSTSWKPIYSGSPSGVQGAKNFVDPRCQGPSTIVGASLFIGPDRYFLAQSTMLILMGEALLLDGVPLGSLQATISRPLGYERPDIETIRLMGRVEVSLYLFQQVVLRYFQTAGTATVGDSALDRTSLGGKEPQRLQVVAGQRAITLEE